MNEQTKEWLNNGQRNERRDKLKKEYTNKPQVTQQTNQQTNERTDKERTDQLKIMEK